MADKSLDAIDISQEFFKLEAMAEATRALLMEHCAAEKDSELVATWLNLQVIAERAHKLGNHYFNI